MEGKGVVLDLLGARYIAGNNAIPGLPAASPEGNASVVFSDGQLSMPFFNNLNISSTNAVTQLPLFTESPYTLSVLGTTGDIKGTFTHTNGTVPSFKGKIYQKGLYKGAHGFFKTLQPKVITGDGEIGNVSLPRLTAPQ